MPFSSYAKGQTELLTLANRIGEEIADNYRQQQTAEALAEYRKEQLANRQDNTNIRRDDLNRKINADAARNQYNYLRTLGVPVTGNSRPRTTSLPGGTVPTYAPAPQRQSPKRTDNYVPYGTPEDNALYANVKRGVPLTADQKTILSEKLKNSVQVPTYEQLFIVVDERGKELLRQYGRDPSTMSPDDMKAALTDILYKRAANTLTEKAAQNQLNLQETRDLENAGADMKSEAEYNKWALPLGPNPLAAVAKLSNQYNAAVQNAEEELKAREKELNRVQNLSGLEARQKLENEIYAKHRVPELKKAWDDLRIPVESAMSGYELLPAEKGGNDVIGTTPDGKPLTYNQHMQNLQKEKLAEIQGMISSYNQTIADRVYRKPRPDAEFVPPTDEEITARYRKDLEKGQYFRIDKREVERDKNSPHYRRYEAMQQAYNSGDYNKVISLMTPEERKAAGIDVRAVNNYIKEENLRNEARQIMYNSQKASDDEKVVEYAVDIHKKNGMPMEQAMQISVAQYNKNKELEKEKRKKESKEKFGDPPEGVTPEQHALASKSFGAQYGNATDEQKKAFVSMQTAYLPREKAAMAEKDPVKKLKMLRKMDEEWGLEAQTEGINLPYLVSPWRDDIYRMEYDFTLQERDKFDNENKVERGYADWLKTDEPLHEYAKRFGVNNIDPNFSYKDYKAPNATATQIESANKTMFPDIMEAARQTGDIGYQPGQVPTVRNPAMISKYDVALKNAKRTGKQDGVIFLTKILPAIAKRLEYNKALSDRERWLNELAREYQIKVPVEK